MMAEYSVITADRPSSHTDLVAISYNANIMLPRRFAHLDGKVMLSRWNTNLALSIVFQHERDVLDMFTNEPLVVTVQRQTHRRISSVLRISCATQRLQDTHVTTVI